MDVHSKEIRSYNMSKIRSENTKPEIKNDNRYPGKPDIVLPKYNTMVFINGCFWHMHIGCSDFSLPKTNTDFWKKKLENNKRRDENVVQQLQKMNWNVIVLWQCELKGENFDNTMEKLVKSLRENKRRK